MTATAHNARLLLLALIGIAPFMVNGLINSKIAHNALLYWGFELLTWIVIPCSVLYFVMRTPGMRLRMYRRVARRSGAPASITARTPESSESSSCWSSREKPTGVEKMVLTS